MKRSEINDLIRQAVAFFAEHKFHLPPFAFWTPDDWKTRGHECDEIRQNQLGWDLTDFGSGDFYNIGLLLFTLRNGNLSDPAQSKVYAEKIMVVRPGQVTPMHCHWSKTEDIINRGGSTLVMEVHQADPHDDLALCDAPVDLSMDGVRQTFPAGTHIRLAPGQSITLPSRVYHSFRAEGGQCLTGEVSMVNDDASDNCFLEGVGRFPDIEEDEPPMHYLCTEYPAVKP